MTPDAFSDQVSQFFSRITNLLENCFENQVDLKNQSISSDSFRASAELSIGLPSISPRSAQGELKVSYRLSLDRTNYHLAVETSEFHIRLIDGSRPRPIIRYEFERHARNKPGAHLHIHSDSVPLAISLDRNGQRSSASDQSKLHYPTGGHRYRVCLEDVIQLAIAELGFRGKDKWEEHVKNGRSQFRSKQAETVIRQNHDLAAQTLRNLGYEVTLETNLDIPSASPSW